MADETFEEIFEELAKYNDRSVIWNNWLDYAIDVNLLTLHKNKSFKKNYHNNEKAYWDMIAAWTNELSTKLEKYPYYDILGEFYEELVQSKAKSSQMGQFFTPPSVTNLLSDLSFHNNLDYQNGIANDPAGGSGRTLLAAYVKSNGKVFCISNDLDETSCKMCALNFFSHGIRGSVLHMDTLEEKFYQGWRINKYLYHGIPIPHIEEINNVDDAYDFFELKKDNNVDKTTVAPTTINTGNVQTTLI